MKYQYHKCESCNSNFFSKVKSPLKSIFTGPYPKFERCSIFLPITKTSSRRRRLHRLRSTHTHPLSRRNTAGRIIMYSMSFFVPLPPSLFSFSFSFSLSFRSSSRSFEKEEEQEKRNAGNTGKRREPKRSSRAGR